MAQENNIWKIRTIKDYPQAHNHILIGKVLQTNSAYVKLHCRTFHFGSSVSSLRCIREGSLENRIVPWNRIEIINEIEGDFDYENSKLAIDAEGQTILKSDKQKCTLLTPYENRR